MYSLGGEHRVPAADQEQLIDGAVVGCGRRDDLRLVGEVGPERREHRRRDEHLLGGRADERRVGVVARQLRAAAVDEEAGAVAAEYRRRARPGDVARRPRRPAAAGRGARDHRGVAAAGPDDAVVPLAAVVVGERERRRRPRRRSRGSPRATRCQMLTVGGCRSRKRARRQRCSSAVTARLADQ